MNLKKGLAFVGVSMMNPQSLPPCIRSSRFFRRWQDLQYTRTFPEFHAHFRYRRFPPGEDIYIRRGRHEIVRRSLDSGEEETIYTDSEGMDQVVLEPRLAYIMKKDTIYRLYIPTRQQKMVFDCGIFVSKSNPESGP